MHALVAAGASFLAAVLWFDLMFDVQARRHRGEALPPEVLTSIAAYYRRVTTDARPMNLLVALVMVLTFVLMAAEIVANAGRGVADWVSLAAVASALGLARTRTVPSAVRLGSAKDTAEVQSRLARAVLRDHQFCLAAMILVDALQLSQALS